MAKKTLTRAERNILWCERNIYIPEGKFVGQPLKMAEFMKDDFRAIFDNKHGTRRAIISRGRKNAKTVETAMLMLLYLVGPRLHRTRSCILRHGHATRRPFCLTWPRRCAG